MPEYTSMVSFIQSSEDIGKNGMIEISLAYLEKNIGWCVLLVHSE